MTLKNYLCSGFALLCAIVQAFWVMSVLALPAGALAEEGLEALEKPPVHSASEIDYPPFCVVGPAGRADGFSVELLRETLAAMGYPVTFRTGDWSDVLAWLENGEVQVLPLVGRTPEREAKFDFTFPYMSLHGAIVVREGTTGIRDLADLRGLQVAVMRNDNAEEFLRRNDLGIHIHTTRTFEQALKGLSLGRYDAVLIQRLVALRLIQESGLANLRIINKPVDGFRQDFCFAVKKGDAATLALLNEGLALVMADGTFRRLHARWFATMELPSHRPLVVGGDENYPPYEYLDDKGEPAGYNVALTRAIAREMGMDVEIRLGPWAAIRDALARGEIDALQGMLYSTVRDRDFDFTPPHTVNHYVGVVRAGTMAPPSTVADLAGMSIVVQEGDIMHDFAAENGLGTRLSVVNAQEDALRELALGLHDCALVARLTALYWIEEHGWKNLEVGRQPLLSPGYCYAVPKGRQALLSHLGDGLKTLDETGEYRRIYEKWMGVYEEPSPALKTMMRYGLAGVAVLLLALACFILWSWSLRRQVIKKTAQLQVSADRFRMFAELAPVGIVISDEQENTLYTSAKFTEMFGYTMDDMPSVKDWWELAYPDEQVRQRAKKNWQDIVEKARQTGSDTEPLEYPVVCRDGTVRRIEFRMASTGKLNVVVFIDVTEREKLHAQLMQAQKMESVGRLAGGVAHDFNNMLSVIMGYTELAMGKTAQEDDLWEDLEEIHTAARRSADITRQLLAFARQQTISPQVLDMNATVESLLKMLTPLIGEDIDLSWKPEKDLWSVKMDPTQINQILANLCVNARDAIRGVGRITIETGNVTLDQAYCNDHQGFKPGSFVLLAVSDDGCGMDAATRSNIFDPFFTTKETGKGTGLGLATVYGIVKQNNGFINVYSEPGKGTTFRLYLPRHSEKIDEIEITDTGQVPAGHGETILVVEDEEAILRLASTILENLGYDVLTAPGPAEALELAGSLDKPLHLLITDVVMPEMNGRDLAERLKQRFSGLKVLFMSGYTANVIAHRSVLDPGVNFIQKPFSNRDLAAEVRRAMAADAGAADPKENV